MKNHFNEEDKQKFIEFLNMTAKHASFQLRTEEIINYFKLLAHMQQSILPKLDANMLEIVKVVEAEKEADANSKPE
jgi:hypothetical protein